MNSESDFKEKSAPLASRPTSANGSASKPPAIVRLSLIGLGHVPAIKNSMFAIVNKENREWKRRAVKLFVSQLLSSIPTSEHGTVTPQSLQSLMQLLPPDDNWKCIPETHVYCRKVSPGEEGADITIELIP